MPALPSLSLLSEETAAELAAQERRSDALDSKSGVLLGFSGVIVPLTISNLHGGVARVGTAFAALAALCAGAAFIPRSFPTLAVLRLRNTYLTADEEFTKLRLLDTRIAIYQHTQRLLTLKAWLVTVASCALGIAVVLTVIAANL